MAKKSSHHRKPSGAAAIDTVEDLHPEGGDAPHESNGSDSTSVAGAAKSKRAIKTKTDQPPDEHFGIGDIKKGAAFVNSIGGLDKAIAILQILKVAKEVQ